MPEKSLKLNFFYNILLQMSKVIFPLITAPYVARVLEPDGVGLVNFASTYAGYFALFAALGIPMYGIREVAKHRGDIQTQTQFVSEVMSLSIVMTIICTLLFLGSLVVIPQLNENYMIFVISGLVLYLTPFRIDWFYQGNEEFGYITFRSLVVKIISILCLFIFVHEKSDLLIYVILGAVCSVINEVWNFVKLWNFGIHPYFTIHFKQHVKPLTLLFSSSIAISIYTILDTLMLGFMSDYSEVGYYNSATHISKAILPIATSLCMVVMPRLSYYTKDENWAMINSLMKTSLSVVSFLCFPLTCALVAIAPTFVPLFYGEQFSGTIVPLQVVSGVITVIGLNNLFGVQILVGLGKDKLFLYAVLVGTFSNFILNLALIPIIGATGAALASVTAEALILAVEIWQVKKYTKVNLSGFKEIFICLILSIAFFPIIAGLHLLVDGWLLIALFTIVGSLFYLTTQYICKNTAMMSFVEVFMKKIHNK